MHLYQLTLQRSNGIGCAVQGHFSGPREPEMVVSHGKAIELLRADGHSSASVSSHGADR